MIRYRSVLVHLRQLDFSQRRNRTREEKYLPASCNANRSSASSLPVEFQSGASETQTRTDLSIGRKGRYRSSYLSWRQSMSKLSNRGKQEMANLAERMGAVSPETVSDFKLVADLRKSNSEFRSSVKASSSSKYAAMSISSTKPTRVGLSRVAVQKSKKAGCRVRGIVPTMSSGIGRMLSKVRRQ